MKAKPAVSRANKVMMKAILIIGEFGYRGDAYKYEHMGQTISEVDHKEYMKQLTENKVNEGM